MSIFRMLFGLLDGLIYWAGAELYDLMIAIASAEVFSNTTIQTVAERVYQLLGLIMLFKLIFSFLTYVINPSDMADKTKGFGNIIKKIIIVLCLIVITPTAFDMSRSIQKVIIEDRVIEYFVFGQVKPTNASAGYNLMYIVGKQFVKPYKCQTADCKTGDKDAKEVCGADWDKHLPTFTTSATNGSKVEAITGKIGDCAYGAGDNEKFRQALYDATTLSADGKYDMSALMNSLPQHYVGGFLAGLGTGADWFVEYNIILSTVVGAAIVYMLIIMCLDVALRSVKLAFYEIIAPIPIVTYIGTKDGKDTMLNKWFGEVLKTYADLFTRIAGLQIAIFFIDQLKSDGFENNGLLVNIFLILGALTFAKNLTKILESMGIKFSGGGFNLKKKFTDDMMGGKRLWQMGSAAAGLAGNTAMAAGRLATGSALALTTGLKNKISGKGFHTNGTFRRSAQAAGARMMASGKATGGRLWKGALLGQDYKAKVGEDAGKYRENMRTSNASVESIGRHLTSGSAAEQSQKFRAAFGNTAGRLNDERAIAKSNLATAQSNLINMETAYKQAADARKAAMGTAGEAAAIAAEQAALNSLTTAQKDVKTIESRVAAIDKQMKRAIEQGPFGKRRWQEYEAYKEFKDLH